MSAFIAEAIGLHFPDGPLDLTWSAGSGRKPRTEFGIPGAAACADWLLSAPPTQAQLQVLASHLTIGETYFFRDEEAFEALRQQPAPRFGFVRAGGGERRLRLWSLSGCCTGEEPYSLAILLHQVLPDIADWRVTILATDINRALSPESHGRVVWTLVIPRRPARWSRKRYFHRARTWPPPHPPGVQGKW